MLSAAPSTKSLKYSPAKKILRRAPSRKRIRATRLVTHKCMVFPGTRWLAVVIHGRSVRSGEIRSLHVLVLGAGFLVMQT